MTSGNQGFNVVSCTIFIGVYLNALSKSLEKSLKKSFQTQDAKPHRRKMRAKSDSKLR
jgi:hypothetical protein